MAGAGRRVARPGQPWGEVPVDRRLQRRGQQFVRPRRKRACARVHVGLHDTELHLRAHRCRHPAPAGRRLCDRGLGEFYKPPTSVEVLSNIVTLGSGVAYKIFTLNARPTRPHQTCLTVRFKIEPFGTAPMEAPILN
mmetsp:Transcript_148913/g.414923  ORF Transcript_148913/g.414923 Transcript_148913/m.414923 type:complete len:137 (+) Transcript_148913:731-1141(+)